ncbi:hypothetical protein EJ05DRAFT_231534 [Pseudovirgaria hyperparasitica]|uniref:Trichothecene 3-O-acetyltransferase n=1 Tax=Pseudovirgaria hyperparasitica TaxID=470096 RepID=A0A6A6VTJ0_9PEZI|nr:uncharacterized protein EJ05DRAFT_231534 [Pseudovirgaria hyperparasitica]KAF2753074.1 hypothetical protein EJ05DRAFT_231534 [Pseudovirgaria hyperparasitica]
MRYSTRATYLLHDPPLGILELLCDVTNYHSTMSPSTRIALSPMDNVMPRFYARLIFCFRTKPNSDPYYVCDTLQKGLERTCKSLPVLTSKIFEKKPSATDSAKGRLELETNFHWVPNIVLNNISDSWDYDDLIDAGMPQDSMDGNVLFPPAFTPDLDAGAPTFVAQANILAGGILLSIGMFHSAIDGTSGMWVMKLWSQHVRQLQNLQDTGPSFELAAESHRTDLLTNYWKLEGNVDIDLDEEHGNKSTEDLWRLIGLNPLNTDQAEFTLPSETEHAVQDAPEMRATVFYFSQSSFIALKKDASVESSCPRSSARGSISANDALMAVLWRGIIAARYPHPQSQQEVHAILDTTMDGRADFSSSLPWTYLGTLIFIVTTRMALSTLVNPETPLSTITMAIRKSADDITKERLHAAYGLATAISDYTKVTFPFASFIPPEICITSWIAWSLFDLDFGDIFANGGQPDLLRVPRREFDGVCRRCVVLPLQKGGGFEVSMSLPKEEMLRLEKDALFTKYAKVVCH